MKDRKTWAVVGTQVIRKAVFLVSGSLAGLPFRTALKTNDRGIYEIAHMLETRTCSTHIFSICGLL